MFVMCQSIFMKYVTDFIKYSIPTPDVILPITIMAIIDKIKSQL